MSPDRDDEYLEDEAEDRGHRRVALAAGWLRALLVLSVLAVVLVITVPYILQWLSGPTPPSPRPALTEPARTEPAKVETPTAPPTATPAPPVAAVAPEAPAKPDLPAAKPELPAKPEPPSTSEPAVKSEPASKSESAPRPSAKPQPKAAAATATSTPTPTTPGGDYWVQVGLFANGDNAERLAKELRDARFPVEVAQTTKGAATSPAKQHEVVVSGATPEAVTAALKGSGTAEPSGDVVVVRPAMDLKDAVALSRRLAGEGLEVRIRRITAAPTAGDTTVYVVRVGGYPTREAAAAGRRELAAKGLGGFVTQGPAK